MLSLVLTGTLAVGLLLSNSGCTLKETAVETPYASESRFDKNFFFKTDKDGKKVPKTFLAGWTPTSTAGNPNEVLLTQLNRTGHVNIEFDITENLLIGKAVSMSDPNRANWKTVITIPITKHYYLEAQKDGRGRDTNMQIENTQRSHFSARPFMDLDFSRTHIKDWSMALFWLGHEVDNVYDIEKDLEHNFFAFTLSATSAGSAITGVQQQGEFRFNFLAFDHDESFVPTPYVPANSKFLNVLHVLGKYQSNDPKNPVFYGAKWDTRKDQKHTIYLYDFPSDYVDVAKEVIELWNDAFERIGQGRPLKTEIGTGAYAFDLRRSSIVWIDDPKLSYSSPLGVGLALTDVRNGKIMWGQVTLWGGRLHEIINNYSPNGEGAGADAKASVQLSLMMNDEITQSAAELFPPQLQALSSFETVRSGLVASLGAQFEGLSSLSSAMKTSNLTQLYGANFSETSVFNPLKSWMDSLPEDQKLSADSQAQFNSLLNQQMGASQKLMQNQSLINTMANDAAVATASLRMSDDAARKMFSSENLQRLIGMPSLEESLESIPVRDARLKQALVNQRSVSKQSLIEALSKSNGEFAGAAAAYDTDRTVEQMAQAYNVGLTQNKNVDKQQALRTLIKDLLLHEVGHVLGLGHNFKENILPDEHSKPLASKYYLKKEVFAPESMKKMAHENQNNFSTVMGYKHGITDILTRYEDLMPGPHDLLVLEYLYNQKYPLYSTAWKGQHDFKMEDIPKNGQLQEKVPAGNGAFYELGYYPACNDFDADYTTDPQCARWDRGYDAPSIVDNYFNDFNGNLVTQLSSFSNSVKGGQFWAYESFLWRRSLETFGRARLFYDYMRQKFQPELTEMISGSAEESTQALLDFSKACQDIYNTKESAASAIKKGSTDSTNEKGSTASPKVLKVLTRPGSEELVKLCVANARTMTELEKLLQLPGKDFTELNFKDKYFAWVQGGEVSSSMSRAFGSWKELARLPIKISALLALTTAQPFITLHGWAWPIPQYSGPDTNYHLSTFYPKEYTSAIASGAEMNLNLSSTTAEEYSSIGKTLMAMGYMLQNQRMSNDSLKVNSPFIQNLRRQTNYRFSTVIIQVTRKEEEGKEIAKKFTGTIHNFFQRGPETLPEIYMYTNDRTVILPPPQSLLLPLNPTRWYSATDGYYYALKMDFDDDDEFDRLKSKNVRKALESSYYQVMKKCVEGDNSNGLRYYFNDLPDEIFPGFSFSNNLHENPEDRRSFNRSIREQFERYYSNNKSIDPTSTDKSASKLFSTEPNPKYCEEAIRGQGLIVMAASVLNGFYFADLFDYVEKGNQ